MVWKKKGKTKSKKKRDSPRGTVPDNIGLGLQGSVHDTIMPKNLYVKRKTQGFPWVLSLT